MFVCFSSPMLLLLLLSFCFPRVTVYNAKGEGNLHHPAQHNSCMTLHCIWYIYLSLKIQKQKE